MISFEYFCNIGFVFDIGFIFDTVYSMLKSSENQTMMIFVFAYEK